MADDDTQNLLNSLSHVGSIESIMSDPLGLTPCNLARDHSFYKSLSILYLTLYMSTRPRKYIILTKFVAVRSNPMILSPL